MRLIGIVGGTGPETTVEYYQRIIALYREKSGDESWPSILINSINAKPLLEHINAGRWDDVTSVFVSAIGRLAAGGAEFAAIAANTPHIVFDQIRARSKLPLVSIVEVAADAAKSRRYKKLGLLGTKFTMQGSFYSDVFSKSGLALIVPATEEQTYVHEKYMGELFYNVVRDDTRDELTGIVSNMVERDGIEAVILGGTELSLILREATCAGIPVLDTTQIHVQAIVDQALS
ncbi:MAG TPA: amino acid racemase [Gemmatimonadaceae bacterium]|nr:amino acid racemase [Gemmatimonadaceae bacterium]